MRVTKEMMDGILVSIHAAALRLNLITEDQKLIYEAGVASGGVAAAVWLDRQGTHAYFVPRFTTDDTRRDQHNILRGVLTGLWSVHHKSVIDREYKK